MVGTVPTKSRAEFRIFLLPLLSILIKNDIHNPLLNIFFAPLATRFLEINIFMHTDFSGDG